MAKDPKIFILSLDGVPYSFLNNQIDLGNFPHMKKLFEQGSFRQMNSVIPAISSVAWSCYMTGKNPGYHNIFGFIDRIPQSLKLFIPMANCMRAKTIWDYLSDIKKKVIVINIPVTSPPRQVNGILIGGFLSSDLDRAVYPASLVPKLKELGYQIDIDAQLAREDRIQFLKDLDYSTNHRLDTATYLMNTQPWDFFHLHVMGTDRINHFLWRRWEDDDPYFAPRFLAYYKKIDDYIGNILLPYIDNQKNTRLILLSDHGFCRLQKEVYVNTYLQQNGWLRLSSDNTGDLNDMHPLSRAYSLIPGRIYLNVANRELNGRIEMGREYEKTREELSELLFAMRDPDTGEKIIDKIYKREEIYNGPFFNQAPDLVLMPVNGYDLKGNINKKSLLINSELEGMHTYDDAFLFIRDRIITKDKFSITDVTPTIFTLMNLTVNARFDGDCLIKYEPKFL